jgi:hypothetical protein
MFVENLLNQYMKIIGIFTDKHELFQAINENIDLILKQELSFLFYNQHQKLTHELSKESSLFLWFQLFKGKYSCIFRKHSHFFPNRYYFTHATR